MSYLTGGDNVFITVYLPVCFISEITCGRRFAYVDHERVNEISKFMQKIICRIPYERELQHTRPSSATRWKHHCRSSPEEPIQLGYL